MADWGGFADDVLDRVVLSEKGELEMSIEDIRIAAHSKASNIYQKWWWEAAGNRAHPQFGAFFHHFLEVIPNSSEDGKLNSITFRIKKGPTRGTLKTMYWRFRKLVRTKRRRELRGWTEFSTYMHDELRHHSSIELPIDNLKMATHSREKRLDSTDWWSEDHLSRDKRTKKLLGHHIKATPVVVDGERVGRVRFEREQ